MMNTKNTRENTRESLKPTRFDYTCARSSKHERRYKIHDQQRTIPNDEHEEHEGNHEGKHERITQTNKIRLDMC